MTVLNKSLPLLKLREDNLELDVNPNVSSYSAINSVDVFDITYVSEDGSQYYNVLGSYYDDVSASNNIYAFMVNFLPEIYKDSLISAKLNLSLVLDNANTINTTLSLRQSTDLSFASFVDFNVSGY